MVTWHDSCLHKVSYIRGPSRTGSFMERHSAQIVHTSTSPSVNRPTLSERVTTPEPPPDSTLSETSKQSGQDKISTRSHVELPLSSHTTDENSISPTIPGDARSQMVQRAHTCTKHTR
ncbi:hypothetical protein PoB_000089500 [Plakobranchus ocellatus]|uniref:Uncharacterized protein n=1 Tax=Plakobranchus ocellatus TaxID=259542 RepID=A0AAV3XU65_9GAST|nr:hypothetical protein PoB_000089500 [Plakobranchus ocellatus]